MDGSVCHVEQWTEYKDGRRVSASSHYLEITYPMLPSCTDGVIWSQSKCSNDCGMEPQGIEVLPMHTPN